MSRRSPRLFAALLVLASTLSCTGDPPTSPAEAPAAQPQAVLAKVVDEDALSIKDMLADPLFQASIGAVTEPSLVEPLLDAVDALARGQVGRAGSLIVKAQDEADALLDNDASADFDTLISWSVIERYFEEAELL